jgi:hypothetical protein
MKTRLNRFRLTIIIALGAAIFLLPGGASAHFLDSNLVMSDVEVGPYRLTVWTTATVVDDTSIHITSRLVDPDTGAPVLAAQVRYLVTDSQGQLAEIICDASPASPVNGFLFEGDVPLPDFGSYRVTVEVVDGQDRGGDATYYFPVYPISTFMQVLVTILLVVGLVATGWIVREGFIIFYKKRSLE